MSKQQPGLLDKLKPKVTQLNKKAVIIIAALVFLVLLIIVVSAFKSAAERQAAQNNVQTGIAKQSKVTDQTAQGLHQLPVGYQDAAAINHLLSRGQKTAGLPAGVKQELADLRREQAMLQTQLAAMHQHPQPHITPQPTMTREATTSAIFFAGGAPRQQNPATRKLADKHAKTKNSATSTSTGKASDYAQQNMQNEKLSFMSGKVDKNIYNKNTAQRPVSKYEVMAGTVIPAELKTEINSNNPGMISAIVTQNVYDSVSGQYLLIPKGSTLLGEYNSKVAFGQYQLQAKFLRLIRPDGTSILLPNQPGTNAMGESGFSDEVNNHWGEIIGAAALSAVFNIPSIIATNQMNSSYTQSCNDGNCVVAPSIGATAAASALQGVGQTASQVGSQLTQRSLNIQPTIIIHANYPFSVMVTKDVVIPPYHTPLEHIPELGGNP